MTPKDLARRGLLLQRLRQFFEQSHVLDGDHCLVGEGLKQFDLRRSKWVNIDAASGQDSGEFPLLEKGNGQIRSITTRSRPLGNRSARWISGI